MKLHKLNTPYNQHPDKWTLQETPKLFHILLITTKLQGNDYPDFYWFCFLLNNTVWNHTV